MKKTSLAKEVNIFVILFLGAAILVFFGLNAPAFFKQIQYRYFGVAPINEPILQFTRSVGAREIDPGIGIATSYAVEADTQEAPTLAPAVQAWDLSPVSSNSELRLVIPKIGADVPIVFPRDDSTAAVLASLEEGVGIYPGSDLPGQLGRGVILGHSSRASWYNGDYATVFALLQQLDVFDEFTIYAGKKKYTYQVFSKNYLSPAATNAILAGPSAGSEIDLITCYPIGSASKRTLIRSVLVNTEPA